MREKILKLLEEFSSLEEMLGKAEVVEDQERYRELTQRHSYLSEVRELWELLERQQKALIDNQQMLKEETDPEMREMLQDEILALEEEVPHLQGRMESLLVPPDKLDSASTVLEIRAGTGGAEAALFVGDCVRMYSQYAANKGWKVEVISQTDADLGGYKEYIFAISGQNVYRLLKNESGVHRVQRVPETETQGRVHTSAVTVAVIPEPPEGEKVKIEEKDLRIDTYRSSGAGGQHVNTTDSAVRITHIPTGVVACCQQERSQHKNKEKALRILAAKIAEEERLKKEAEMSHMRQSQMGSGDRSERIRTYNFPQNRVTDHRINLTLYKLDLVLEGDLDELTEALVAHFYQLKLQA